MPQAAGAGMGSRGWGRPVGCRIWGHKCRGFNGLRVRKIRRSQMAYTGRRGPCATHGTSDPNLLSEPRIGPVRRCASQARLEPAPGAPLAGLAVGRAPASSMLTGHRLLALIFGRIAASARDGRPALGARSTSFGRVGLRERLRERVSERLRLRRAGGRGGGAAGRFRGGGGRSRRLGSSVGGGWRGRCGRR